MMTRFYTVLVWIGGLLTIGACIIVAASPYGKTPGFNYKVLKHTVHINASSDSVFRFLGNSANATHWSVFVHHISPLNADSIMDGAPGSCRRCFCSEDETGTLWDETILEVKPGFKRQISCYAFKGFPMTVEGIATEQLYESKSNGACNLTFTFFIKDRNPNLFELIKLHIGSFRVYSIFKRNLENIKSICEGKQPLHPREY